MFTRTRDGGVEADAPCKGDGKTYEVRLFQDGLETHCSMGVSGRPLQGTVRQIPDEKDGRMCPA